MHEIVSYEPSCVKISSVVFFCKRRQEKRKRKAQSHASVIFHLFVGKPPVNGFSLNFAHHMLDVINHLRKLWCGKIKGFGKYEESILELYIEMAGHPYNRAGATAQPVMNAPCSYYPPVCPCREYEHLYVYFQTLISPPGSDSLRSGLMF